MVQLHLQPPSHVFMAWGFYSNGKILDVRTFEDTTYDAEAMKEEGTEDIFFL
jgi:hypothetical protein